MSAVEAALAAYEQSKAVPAAVPQKAPAPSLPWQSSIGGIQSVSEALLETNRKLSVEAAQLAETAAGLQARIDALEAGNAGMLGQIEDLRARRDDGSAAAEVFRLKNILEDREHEMKVGRQDLAALRVREKSAHNSLALAKLRVAGLEVDKKSREVDVRMQDEADFKALRAENEALKDRIARSETQIRLLNEKTDELGKVEQPYVPRAREIAAKNAELRDRLTVLEAGKASQQSRFEELASRKLKMESARNVRVVEQLAAERASLGSKLSASAQKLEDLKAASLAATPAPVAEDRMQELERLERQNAAIEGQVSDLRENVALLEYKVNTLERYKGRKDPAVK